MPNTFQPLFDRGLGTQSSGDTPHKDSNQVFSFHDRDVSVLVHLAHCKDKYTE